MIEPWVRFTLKLAPSDFVELITRATPYSAYLRSVRILSWETVQVAEGSVRQRVVILVDPEIARDWTAEAEADNFSYLPEGFGEEMMLIEAIGALDVRGLLPDDDDDFMEALPPAEQSKSPGSS